MHDKQSINRLECPQRGKGIVKARLGSNKKEMVTTIVSLNQQSTHVLQGRG